MSEANRRTDLQARLLELISRGVDSPVTEQEFDALAREIFRYQYDHNVVYRRYCDARGATPDQVRGWREVPAVPTDAFKAADLVSGDPAAAEVVFRTSGTTADVRGVHRMLDTRIYREALAAGFRYHLLPHSERRPILSLIAPADEVPDSSLSFMISEVVERFGAAGSHFFASADGPRVEEFARAARRAQEDGPVVVVGTSLAFVHLLDHLGQEEFEIVLPPGSAVMDTGGFKGRGREVSREELYGGIGERLGVPLTHIVNEYGMTEMTSQFYDGVAGSAAALAERRYRGPGWVRTLAADPETLRPLPEGEVGVLRHVDLGNLDSVIALQTADLGAVVDGEVRLLGRARGAEARGCSIAVDELLAAAGGRSRHSRVRGNDE